MLTCNPTKKQIPAENIYLAMTGDIFPPIILLPITISVTD
jgi:hypothetical protein